MEKCDVCGKTSMLPERFGHVNLCKFCFIKVNGIFWKKDYDRYEDAEENRCKALQAIHEQQYPEHVVFSVNDYFISQMNTMIPCDCCGHPVRHRQIFDNFYICKKCFKKINIPAWKQEEYEDNHELEANRQKLLQVATDNSFPVPIVAAINKHFDAKTQIGLMFSINGHNGQRLKIFTDHCELITDDSFDVEELSKTYAKILKKQGSHNENGSFITSGTAKTLARNVLSRGLVKGLVRTGISAATSAAIEKTTTPQHASFKITKGSYNLDYRVYSYADLQNEDDYDVGFIRFVNVKGGSRQCDDILFFFNIGIPKIADAFKAISENIDRATSPVSSTPINTVPPMSVPTLESTQQYAPIPQAPNQQYAPIPQATNPQCAPQPSASAPQYTPLSPASTVFVADEILKLKNLLDIGVLTQEEFDAKKKELLNL